MDIQSIFVNLPVQDVARSREFWTNLGVVINEDYSSEDAISLVLKENNIHVMLLSREYFATFTNRPLADGTSTQVLNALQLSSREQVHSLVSKAIELGATRYQEPKDHGWMYYDSFADLDGHQWEITWMDPAGYPMEE